MRRSLLAASLRAQATPANPPPTMTTRAPSARAWSCLVGKRGPAARRPTRRRRAPSRADRSGARRSRMVVASATSRDGGSKVVPRRAASSRHGSDVRPARAQGILGDRADDLLEAFARVGGLAGRVDRADRSPSDPRAPSPVEWTASVGIGPPLVPRASDLRRGPGAGGGAAPRWGQPSQLRPLDGRFRAA